MCIYIRRKKDIRIEQDILYHSVMIHTISIPIPTQLQFQPQPHSPIPTTPNHTTQSQPLQIPSSTINQQSSKYHPKKKLPKKINRTLHSRFISTMVTSISVRTFKHQRSDTSYYTTPNTIENPQALHALQHESLRF